jgi:hypothetical protein
VFTTLARSIDAMPRAVGWQQSYHRAKLEAFAKMEITKPEERKSLSVRLYVSIAATAFANARVCSLGVTSK